MVYYEANNRTIAFWRVDTEVWMAVDGEHPRKIADFPSNQPKTASYLNGLAECIEILKEKNFL